MKKFLLATIIAVFASTLFLSCDHAPKPGVPQIVDFWYTKDDIRNMTYDQVLNTTRIKSINAGELCYAVFQFEDEDLDVVKATYTYDNYKTQKVKEIEQVSSPQINYWSCCWTASGTCKADVILTLEDAKGNKSNTYQDSFTIVVE